MFYAKQIADLKAQVQDLQGQLKLATDNTKSLIEDKGKLEVKIGDLEAAQTDAVLKAAHDEALKLKDGEIAKLTEQLTAAQKDVDGKVVQKMAEAGVPAVKRDPKAVDTAVKPSAANGQTPRQRLAALTKVAGESGK